MEDFSGNLVLWLYIKEKEYLKVHKNNAICENLDELDKIKEKLNICYVRVSSRSKRRFRKTKRNDDKKVSK